MKVSVAFDATTEQHDVAIIYDGVCAIESDVVFPDRFDLGPFKNNTRFERFQDLVLEAGFPVLANDGFHISTSSNRPDATKAPDREGLDRVPFDGVDHPEEPSPYLRSSSGRWEQARPRHDRPR